MDPLLPLLGDLTLLIGASAAVAYVAHRYLGIVPLVGFLLTGALIGPNSLGLVSDPHLVELAAEIGVILLLFTIGIEFSLERLARIRRLIFGGGTMQVLLTGAAVFGILVAFGVSARDALYTGMLATLSSTVIALKLLSDRGATGTPEGQAALGILLFQDLAVVLMMLLLPALAGDSGGGGVLLALGEAAGIILFVLVLARRLMPPFLERVARACSPDIFLLTIIAICFGTAWLAAAAGIGVSLGAFLAGLIVSESRFSEHALSEVLPL
ncbi:MAG: cation:proton antiporter, partial [Gemmatimonadota bacterium]